MSVITRLMFMCAVLGCALAAPSLAQAADFSGTWQVTGHIQQPGGFVGQVSPVCVFHQSGGVVSGECKGPNSEGAMRGAVDGNKIVWHWSLTAITSIGGTGVASFSGIRGSDGVIRGTWTATFAPGTGDWTGTKIK
jgi:hypothetical protein